jgi:pimeloyl-ACP methyl ester carboxylesterase
MSLPLLLLAALGLHPVADSTVRAIVVAPAETLRVTIDGPSEGPTVVIIPGVISPAFAFRGVLPRLSAAGVRTVVIEPLGMGASGRPGNANYSFAAQAERVQQVLDSLHISRAVLVGHVVGGTIALRLAVSHPRLVRGILLIESAAYESAAVPGVRSALKYALVLKIFAGRGRLKKQLRKGLIESSGDTTWITEPVLESYTQGGAGDVGAVLRALKGMQNSPEPDSLVPHLGEIQVPVRLLLGGAAHDGGPSAGRVHTMERHLADFRIRTVFGAGAHIHEEQPELVAEEALRLVHEAKP